MDRRFRAVRGKRFVVLGLTTVLLASLTVMFPPHRKTLSRASASTANAPHTLIGKYCMSCHDAEEHEANLAFETLDFSRVDADAGTWEKVRRKLTSGVMPPAGQPRPSKAEIDDFITALTLRLDATAPAAAPVALRRLNRTEYANVIRDLLGLQIDAAALLPPDAASKGFDNISAVLSTSPALIQGYLDAAMKVSRLAVGDLSTEAARTVYRAPRALNQETQLEGLPLGTRGGIRVSHFFPLDAEYEISVEAGPGASGGGAGRVGLHASSAWTDARCGSHGRRSTRGAEPQRPLPGHADGQWPRTHQGRRRTADHHGRAR
jgi:hypothetical protein